MSIRSFEGTGKQIDESHYFSSKPLHHVIHITGTARFAGQQNSQKLWSLRKREKNDVYHDVRLTKIIYFTSFNVCYDFEIHIPVSLQFQSLPQ